MTYQPPQPYGSVPPGYAVRPPPAKKKNTTAIVLAVTGGALMLCCGGIGVAALAGGETEPKTTVVESAEAANTPTGRSAKKPEQPDGFGLKPGATVTVDTDDGKLQVTVKSMKTFTKGCGSFSPEPEQGIYAVVDVRVTAVEGSSNTINPLYFEWVGDDGVTADSISGAFSGCEKSSLTSTNSLRAGQQRAGQIVFDVPSRKGSVEYAPAAFEDTVASWSFS